MSLSLPITKIVIHCSATRNGKQLRTVNQTAAQRIKTAKEGSGFKQKQVCSCKLVAQKCTQMYIFLAMASMPLLSLWYRGKQRHHD